MKTIVDPFDAEIVYAEQDDGSLTPLYIGNIDPRIFEGTPKTIKGGADG